jgi:Tol biopolymer transport system component
MLCSASLALAITVIGAASAGATAPVGTNGKIAYGSTVAAQSDIYTINPDGTAPTNLTHTTTGGVNEVEPSWSPLGTKIAFTLCTSGTCDVAVMNPDGSGLVNLTNTPVAMQEQRAAFSPDGQLIAYDRTDSSFRGIWVMNADGSNPHRLTDTTTPETDFAPDFSPDGGTITFTRCRGGTGAQCDIWVMNADGTNQRNLTTSAAPSNELGGSFSPNGASIVFQFDDGNDDLAIMNADGSGKHFLTDTSTAAERRPVFSGDGTKLAFAGFNLNGSGTADVYVSDTNAQGGLDITNTPSSGDFDSNPDWEDVQTCGTARATIVGDDGPDRLLGTSARDVIDANGADSGKNVVKGRAGNDLICIAGGKAKVNCGKGARDKVISLGPGKHKTKGCERLKGKGFKKPGS